jgi:molybdopterin molybdotransferase
MTGRSGTTGPDGMQSVDEYLAEISAAITPLAPRELGLADAEGATVAADVTAGYALPPFDNSAMDGFAVVAADLAGATGEHPVTLPVAGEVPAGDTREHRLEPGSVLRIMTGAPLPSGADAVVPVELTGGGDGLVTFHAAVEPGGAVRLAGGDVTPGDLLLPAGTSIGPVELGLLAAAGNAVVLAHPRPRVAVISTGNELAEPGTPLARGQIWESNSVMLAAAARADGAEAYRPPSVPDDKAKVLAMIEAELEHADLLVTSGGVSMGGEHDVVKAALLELGEVRFRKVAMQPGMPQGFGLVGPGRTPILTLPGNPVSAYVSYQLFGRLALNALQGRTAARRATARIALTGPLRSPNGKRSFLRGAMTADRTSVTPLTGQASHQLATLARADALIVVPEEVTAMTAGDLVDVLFLHV